MKRIRDRACLGNMRKPNKLLILSTVEAFVRSKAKISA